MTARNRGFLLPGNFLHESVKLGEDNFRPHETGDKG